MSFADVGRGGSGGGSGGGMPRGPGGVDAFQEASRTLASLVFQMNTEVAGFRRLVDALGTVKDTKELRGKIAAERESISKQARDANARLKKLGNIMSAGTPTTTVKAVHSRLISDLQGVLKEFQRAQRLCAEKEVQFVPRQSQEKAQAKAAAAAAAAMEGDDEREKLLEEDRQRESQQQALLEQEMEYKEALIDERDEGIEAIQHSIGEVNEIFQDLAVLVEQQGGQIDDIENNITSTAIRTAGANQELLKAERHQRASRKRLCVIMLIVMIAVLIIVLTIKK